MYKIINTVLLCLTLLVALVVAWFDLSPVSDELQVISLGRINIDIPIEVTDRRINVSDTEGVQAILGPVVWKLHVNNETDHVVSIIDYEVFFPIPDSRGTMYSSFGGRLSPIDPDLPPLDLPVNIGAYNTNVYLVSTFAPFDGAALEQFKCLDADSQLHDIENCFSSNGVDLFENSVSRASNGPGQPFTMPYNSGPDCADETIPKPYVRLYTADGSIFRTYLSYCHVFAGSRNIGFR